MATIEKLAPPLVDGEHLTREEFLRRWDAEPERKRAELIEGVVYLGSPLSRSHAEHDAIAGLLLATYAAYTSGCAAGHAATVLIDRRNVPQPDVYLRIGPEYGGQSGLEGDYCAGVPELIIEVTLSSRSIDLTKKRDLYLRAGVREYGVLQPKKSSLLWLRRGGEGFQEIQPDADGVLRSTVFPGLWLSPSALLQEDGAKVLEVLHQGLRTDEHRAFVAQLAAQKRP